MKYFILCGLSVFLFVNCVGSFLTKGPFFWTAKKDGKTHHLLGTMHINLDIEDLQCSEVIKDRLQNSRLLFTEINMDSFQTQKTLQNTPQQGLQNLEEKGESAFWKSLTEEQKNILLRKYTELFSQNIKNLNPENIKETLTKFNRNETGAVLINICLAINEQKKQQALQLKFKNKRALITEQQKQFLLQSLDSQVYQLASQYAVDQAGLEIVEEHFEIIKDVNQVYQDFVYSNLIAGLLEENFLKEKEDFNDFCSNLKSVLKENRKKREQLIIKMSKDIKEGIFDHEKRIDLNLILDSLAQYNIPDTTRQAFVKSYKKHINQKILKDRHEKWLPQIIQAHQEYDSFFIAVGLFHFIGEYDMLNLLKKEGFKIKRFSRECQEE